MVSLMIRFRKVGNNRRKKCQNSFEIKKDQNLRRKLNWSWDTARRAE